MASSVVFKVKHNDTLRRFNVLVNEGQRFDLDMEGLRLKICSLFDLTSTPNFSLVYTDEDNDLVTLGNDEDLQDVLKQGLNPVRITVCLKKDTTSKFNVPSSENPTPGSSSIPNSEQPKVNPSVAEVLKSVPEPLRQAISKISTELTSKAASSSPVLGDLLDGLSKMGQSYLTPSPSCDTRFDPKEKARSEPKVDASMVNKGVKFNDIPSSSSVRESDFPQPPLSSTFQFDDKNETFEQMKYKEDYEKVLGKYRGCRMLNSSKVGMKKRISCEKDASKSGAFRHNRGFISGRNPSKPYHPSGSECPFSGVPPFLDRESSMYDFIRPGQTVNDNSYKADGMGSIFHKGVRCDGCGVLPITGPRFKSKVKHDYDLCKICFGRMGNDLDFIRIDFPLSYRHPWAFKDFYDPALHLPSVLPPWMSRQHSGKQSRSKLDSRFIMDVNVLDGTVMAPLTPFTKIWRMRNNGNLPWQRGVRLLWIGGDHFTSSDSVEIQVPIDGVSVGKEIDIAVDFIAPELPGRYISYWRMAEPSGQKFGQRVWVLIQVDSSVDLSLESSSGLNLNLPPETNTTTFDPQVLDENKPEPNTQTPLNSPSMVDRRRKIELEDLNFPINDDLLVTNDVVGSTSVETSSSSSVPVVGPTDNGAISEASSSLLNSDKGSRLYPIIDMNEGSYGSSSSSKNEFEKDDEKNRVEVEVEETLLKELEDMGFKEIDLNKEVLRVNDYDLEKSVDELSGISEWDPILDELKEMGFEDKETNRKLLEKNNGSITRVVMDLIAGEKP